MAAGVDAGFGGRGGAAGVGVVTGAGAGAGAGAGDGDARADGCGVNAAATALLCGDGAVRMTEKEQRADYQALLNQHNKPAQLSCCSSSSADHALCVLTKTCFLNLTS